MADKIISQQQLYQPSVLSVNQLSVQSSATLAKQNQGQGTFAEALQQKLTEVKFSQHALQRLQSRNLQLGSEDMAKLNGAVQKAEQKGAKESLIIINNMALVVSVKNRTVITAMDAQSMRDNVFTNIDSAVIV